MNGHRVFMIGLFSLATAGMLLSNGCACFDRQNRRLLNQMDDWIHPKSITAQVALAPLSVPVGTLGLATDSAVVHPACMIPRAANDVYNLYWKPREMDFMRKALLFIPIMVLTPPTFVSDWSARSLFDVTEYD